MPKIALIPALMLLAMVAVALAAAVWLWRLARAPVNASSWGACAHCGYNVTGLTTFICPECGGDLRAVGIVRGGAAGAMAKIELGWKLAAFVVFWVIVSPCIMSPIAEVLAARGSERWVWYGMPLLLLAELFVLALGLVLVARSHRRLVGADAAAAALPVPPALPTRDATRTLTVMFIDVQAYTPRAAAASSERLIELLCDFRQLVQPIAQRRGGRMVKTLGDGLLLTFDSATQALLAAREVQTAAQSRNLTVRQERRIDLRIGVSTGEVLVQPGDVLGDTVNFAARIQQLAPACEVWFSESTWHAMNRNETMHAEVGAFEVQRLRGNGQAVSPRLTRRCREASVPSRVWLSMTVCLLLLFATGSAGARARDCVVKDGKLHVDGKWVFLRIAKPLRNYADASGCEMMIRDLPVLRAKLIEINCYWRHFDPDGDGADSRTQRDMKSDSYCESLETCGISNNAQPGVRSSGSRSIHAAKS